MDVRLLCLDDPWTLEGALRQRGYSVELTALEPAEVYAAERGRYQVSLRGLTWVRRASLERYDVVVIADNNLSGLVYAHLLPVAMRPATLIFWNHSASMDVTPYARLGYGHFGSREGLARQVEELHTLLRESFLQQRSRAYLTPVVD